MESHIDVAQFFRERIERRRLQQQRERMMEGQGDDSDTANIHYMECRQNGAHTEPQRKSNATKATCEDFRGQALAVPLLGVDHQLSCSLVTIRKNFKETMDWIYEEANIPRGVSFKTNVMQMTHMRTQAFQTVGVKPTQCKESERFQRIFRERLVSCLEETDDLDDPRPEQENTYNSSDSSGSDDRRGARTAQMLVNMSSPSVDKTVKDKTFPEQTNEEHKTPEKPFDLSGDKEVPASSSAVDTSTNLPKNDLRNTAAPNPKGRRCLYLEPAPGTPEVHITRPRSMRQNRGSCKAIPQTDRMYSINGASIKNRCPPRLSYCGNSNCKFGTRHFDNPASSPESPKPRCSSGSAIYRILSGGLFPDAESSHVIADSFIPQVSSPVSDQTDANQGRPKGLFLRAKTQLSHFCRRLVLCFTSVTTD